MSITMDFDSSVAIMSIAFASIFWAIAWSMKGDEVCTKNSKKS